MTRIPFGMKDKDYSTRCKLMGIEQLTDRRKRGDLIEMYKFQKCLEIIKWTRDLNTGPPRGHRRSQLRREVVKNNQRHNFFLNRVANAWNALPNTVINAPSTNSFKVKLDQFRTDVASKGSIKKHPA